MADKLLLEAVLVGKRLDLMLGPGRALRLRDRRYEEFHVSSYSGPCASRVRNAMGDLKSMLDLTSRRQIPRFDHKFRRKHVTQSARDRNDEEEKVKTKRRGRG